jgi:hypothetical protein
MDSNYVMATASLRRLRFGVQLNLYIDHQFSTVRIKTRNSVLIPASQWYNSSSAGRNITLGNTDSCCSYRNWSCKVLMNMHRVVNTYHTARYSRMSFDFHRYSFSWASKHVFMYFPFNLIFTCMQATTPILINTFSLYLVLRDFATSKELDLDLVQVT